MRWHGVVVVGVMVSGCGPSVDGGDGSTLASEDSGTSDASASNTSSSSSSSSSSATTTSASTAVTTVEPGTSEGEGGCGPNPCEPCGPSCVDEQDCIDGEWMCGCVCSDPDPCPTTPESDFAHMSKTEPFDCGDVDGSDDDAAWQAVHDCVLGQSAVQEAFWASWYSDDDYAVAGAVGVVYALAWFWSPGDVVQYDCSAIAATEGCVVATGEMCLTCVRMGNEQTICTSPK